MGQGELVKRLPGEVILKNKSYQPLSVLQKEGRYFMYRTILKTLFVRGTIFRLMPYLLSLLADMLKKRKILPDKLLWRVLSDGGERFAEEYDLAVAYLEGDRHIMLQITSMQRKRLRSYILITRKQDIQGSQTVTVI